MGESEGCVEQVIWIGDFNLHHPLWDKEHNSHLFTRGNLEKSQVLIAELDFQKALPNDIPTLQALATGNHTRPDNVFISSQIMGHITRCTMLPDERPARSDHIPVVTEVEISLEEMGGATAP